MNRVYQLIEQHPSLAQDAHLMLNEALMFKAALRLSNAKQVMEQAYKLRPDDPDILGQLGLLR